MSVIVKESYIGAGIVYVAGRDVGNASGVEVLIEQEGKSLPNHRGGGGNYDSVTKVSSVKLKMTLNAFSNENLALALRGKVSVLTADPVTDELVVAKLDGLAPTEKLIDISQPVTVTNSDGTTEYDVDVDYYVSAAGIRAIGTGAIVDEAQLKVSYTSAAGNALEALTEAGVTVPVVIDGMNDANGKPCVLRFYLWKPSPTSSLSLITDDYGSFDIEGEVLANDAIVAAGKSKFFKRLAA
ncbi:phage tail tube protein [Shewanella sp. JL219SE-S6]